LTVQIVLHKTGINDLALFKRILRFLSNLIKECELKFKDHDIIIETMDDPRTALLRIVLKDILEQPINAKVGVNIKDLCKLLAVMKYAVLDLEFTRSLITLKKNNEKFTLKTIEFYDGEEIPFENLQAINYNYTFTFDWTLLNDTCKKASLYGDLLDIYFDNEGVQFEAEGNMGKYERNEGLKQRHKDWSATFSLKLFRLPFNGTKRLFPEEFTLRLRTGHPIKIVYDTSTIKLEQWIAPRIEEADWEDDDEY